MHAWPGTGAGNLARVVSTEDWGRSLGSLVAPGIIDDGTYTTPGQPFGDATGMWVKVHPYLGTLRAFFAWEDATVTVPVAPNTASQPRIDLISLHLDLTTQTLSTAATQGTPGSSPSAPTPLSGQGDVWDATLGYVRVEAGAGTLGNAIQTITSDKVTAAVLLSPSTTHAPLGILTGGYVASTSGSTPGSALVDIPSMTRTVSVGAGRRIRVTFTGQVGSSVAGDTARIRLLDGATIIQLTPIVVGASTATYGGVTATRVLDHPTAGSHTFKAQIERTAGTGNVFVATTSTAELTVEDIGV